MKKYKSLLFCTADPTKNVGNVRDYFIENSQNFVAFHFFPSYTNASTFMEKYVDGKRLFKKEFTFYKGNSKLLKNIFDFAYFSFVLLVYTDRRSFVIMNAPFYCIFNSFFSFLKSFRYVLWIGDYYSSHKFPMNIYNMMVDELNRSLSYVLYLSPPLEEIYFKKVKNSNKYRDLVSLGIKKRNTLPPLIPSKRIIVGFIGIIRQQQGLDLFFKYLANSSDCILEIVGDGYSLSYYKKLAKELGIENKVKFYGRIEDLSQIFRKWNIGIALYEEKIDNLSIYCEPTKIKDYLSFGIPVITTRTTYFGKEIEAYKAGIVIDENIASLKNAISLIIKNYKDYLGGVNRLLAKYEYSKWYDEKFTFLKKIED